MSECQGQSDGGPTDRPSEEVAATGSSGMDEKSSILSASENANNENREIELRQNAIESEEELDNDNGDADTTSEESSSNRIAATESSSNATAEKVTTPSAGVASQQERDALKEYAEHVTYDEHGDAIYTDPATKVRYKWDKLKNEWALPEGQGQVAENEHYRWCSEKGEWVLKETVENEHYRWCKDTQKWIPKAGAGGAAVRIENGEHVYTDKEGMTFFWDTEKNAWFPKIDDDFMAVYQMNYGFIDNTSAATAPTEVPKSTVKVSAPRNVEGGGEEEDVTTEKPKSKRKAQEPPSK